MSIQGIVKIAAGIIMVVMGINMLGLIPGLRRFGLHMPVRRKHRTSAKRTPFVVGLCNGLMPCGPLQSTVKAGIPVVWTIEAPAGTVNGCNYKILLQDFGEEITLDEGENVVEFTPTKTGTYPYYCWMGMIRGSISVEE